MMCHPDIRPTFNIYGDVVTDAMTTASAKVAQLYFCAEIGRLGLARICNATAITTKKRSAKPPKVFSDPDGCDVYSAVLPMDEWYWQNSKTLLIVQELPPDEWPIGSPKSALQGNFEFRRAFAPVFRSFDEVTRREALLECNFTVQKSYKMVSKATLHAAFRHLPPNAISDGWEGFRDSFPDSNRLLDSLRRGFQFRQDHRTCVRRTPPICGRCWCKERSTFWGHSGWTATCGAGD